MQTNSENKEILKTFWQGRVDGHEPEDLRWHQVINFEVDKTDAPNAWTFVGFPMDEGVQKNQGRVGAKDGPAVLRRACANFPAIPSIVLTDSGDIAVQPITSAHLALTETVENLHRLGHRTVVLGGGHDIMFPHFMGLRKIYPTQKIGIINLDAHFDNRPVPTEGPNSGTGFFQLAAADTNHATLVLGIQENANTARLFEFANAVGTQYILASEIDPKNEAMVTQKIESFFAGVDLLYLTICLDVFATPNAPGVSAPTAFGIEPNPFFRQMLKRIAASPKFVGFDLAEMNPAYDIDHRTAKLAASCVFEILAAAVK